MASLRSRFHFASAPVSWAVQDYYDPAWEQPYEQILDEMVEGGYEGTELGPFGYFPKNAETLRPVLAAKSLTMLSSFVPVDLSDAGSAKQVIEHICEVGSLLAALKAPCIVLADAQSKKRESMAGRVPSDGSASLTAEQWRAVTNIIGEAARVASGFGLDLVFHPHVATYVETPEETERFFDATAGSGIGLCLDTGHCHYGRGNPTAEAEKYKGILRYVHIKDIDQAILDESNRKGLTFDEAVEAGVFTEIGKGCIDFDSFFGTLDKNGYSGWFVVEQDIKFGVSPVPPKVSMTASLKYLHRVLERLEEGTGK
jgi:inosose dehydratase